MASYLCSTMGMHIDPTWLQRYKHGQHPCVIKLANGLPYIELGKETLRVKDCPLPAGTKVVAYLSASGFFYCESESDIQAREEQERQAQLQKQRLRSEQDLKERLQAQQFNARIQLPVQWCAGHKSVLSGLSERSLGNGRNKASVEHILLKEDLNAGRLQRKAGSFLCTTASGSNGQRYGTPESSLIYDEHGPAYPPKITCTSCLKAAARWIKEP